METKCAEEDMNNWLKAFLSVMVLVYRILTNSFGVKIMTISNILTMSMLIAKTKCQSQMECVPAQKIPGLEDSSSQRTKKTSILMSGKKIIAMFSVATSGTSARQFRAMVRMTGLCAPWEGS